MLVLKSYTIYFLSNMFKFFLIIVFGFFTLLIACNSCSDQQSMQFADSLSIDQLSTAIHKNPNNGELLFIRAKKYYENKQLNEAITDLNSAIQKDDAKDLYYILLSEYYLFVGQSENTKDILERCIKKFPKSTAAMQKLAQLHFYVKQYKKALEILVNVQEIDENIPQIYFLRGLILEESGDTVNAINQFKISTEKDPKYYEAYIILGLRYTDKRDSLALDYFRNALRLQPNSTEAYFNIAFFYQKIGKLKKAVDAYEEIVTKIDSSYKSAYYNLGYIHLEYFKEYSKAASFFQKAIDCDGLYSQAWYNLGLCFEKMKDYKKATVYYKQSLVITPEFELAMERLKRVER